MAINDILVSDLSSPSRVSDFRVTAANPLLNQRGIIDALPEIMSSPGVRTIEGSLIPGDRTIPSYENYEDLIMNPDFMPNRLQNLERFADNRFEDFQEIPGFDFKDAPIETPFLKRMFDDRFKEFRNNPRTGIIDNLILSRGNPEASLVNRIKDTATSGVRKGVDLGKAAISGILSLATGIPGIGALANLLPERDYRQSALEDFYGSVQNGTIQSGLMAGYNPVSGGLLNMLTGGRYGDPTQFGLAPAIDKRIATIRKTLKRKDSKVLEQRLKDLQELKKQEAAALEAARAKQAAELESQRRGRRPTAPSGGGTRDDQGDRSSGQTGGYSYDSGGRQGFGYGL